MFFSSENILLATTDGDQLAAQATVERLITSTMFIRWCSKGEHLFWFKANPARSRGGVVWLARLETSRFADVALHRRRVVVPARGMRPGD